MPEWSLFSRDESARLSGGMRLSSLRGVVRHLGVDTAVVETPYTEVAYARTAPGCGLVAQRDGRREISGVVGSERTMGWDAERGRPTILVKLVGDNVHPADRLVYPDPTRAGDDQTSADFWSLTGPASTAMWQLVNANLGPAARAERRVPRAYMGADPGVGTARVWQAQFEPVLDACARISALSSPSPGLRATSTADGLRYEVYAPRDLSGQVRFSADLRNLVAFEYSEVAPSVTYAIAAGQGDQRNRIRRAATSTNPLDLRWGRRIERYLDRRDEPDATKLQQYAADEVESGQGQVNLACTLTDSEAATYGVHWGLGDRTSVQVGLKGQTKVAVVVDLVREILLEVDNSGKEKIQPAIGGFDAKAIRPTPTQQQLAQVGRSLSEFFTRK